MKHYTLFSCILPLLGATSCISSRQAFIAPGIPTFRIASVEYQFIDSTMCRDAAQRYCKKTTGSLVIPASSNPSNNIYSFRKKPCIGKKTEVRFVVGPNGAKTGKKYSYLEIPKSSGSNDTQNGTDINTVVNKLTDLGFAILLPPNQDVEVNSKKAWRAILYPKATTTPSKLYKRNGGDFLDFGIIINPPYPP